MLGQPVACLSVCLSRLVHHRLLCSAFRRCERSLRENVFPARSGPIAIVSSSVLFTRALPGQSKSTAPCSIPIRTLREADVGKWQHSQLSSHLFPMTLLRRTSDDWARVALTTTTSYLLGQILCDQWPQCRVTVLPGGRGENAALLLEGRKSTAEVRNTWGNVLWEAVDVLRRWLPEGQKLCLLSLINTTSV